MKYFTISEMIHSRTAVERKIWNGCGRAEEDNLTALAEQVLDPARERYGRKVTVNSGYRCPELNSVIRGATRSQHLRGEAADLTTEAGPQGNLELARIIVALGRFDQLILENVPGTNLLPGWIHVSWKRCGGNRGQILKKVVGSSGYVAVSEAEILSGKSAQRETRKEVLSSVKSEELRVKSYGSD